MYNDNYKMTAVDACVGSYLKHYGTKGMKWRQHGEGKRWQSHAVYANGMKDPDTKEKGGKLRSVAKGVKSGVVNGASAVKKEVGDYHRAKTPEEIKQFIGKLDERYAKAKGNVSKFGLKAEKTLATVKLGKKLRRAGTRHVGAAVGAAAAATTMTKGAKALRVYNTQQKFKFLRGMKEFTDFVPAIKNFYFYPGATASRVAEGHRYLTNYLMTAPQLSLILPTIIPTLSTAAFVLGTGIDTGLSYRRGRRELNNS